VDPEDPQKVKVKVRVRVKTSFPGLSHNSTCTDNNLSVFFLSEYPKEARSHRYPPVLPVSTYLDVFVNRLTCWCLKGGSKMFMYAFNHPTLGIPWQAWSGYEINL